jgi:hypothetical protein
VPNSVGMRPAITSGSNRVATRGHAASFTVGRLSLQNRARLLSGCA